MNPAAVTARDTLSFMADFGLDNNNVVYRQGDVKSANNTFNISDFVISFPIWKSLAFMVGINPMSDVGYNFSSIETDPNIIGNTGNIVYSSYGEGGMYQIFAAAGVQFFKRLSLGAEWIYNFGSIDKATNMIYSTSSYRSMYGGYTMDLKGSSAKFGLQYEQKLGSTVSLCVGATYKLSSSLKGHVSDYRYASLSSVTDTLRNNIDTLSRDKIKTGNEIGVGLSVKIGDKFSAEFDYLRADWTNSGFDSTTGFAVTGSSFNFASSVSQAFRFGMEYVPNRNDIRYYYKRMSYRLGAYYETMPYTVNGHDISDIGVTIGTTLPVFRWYNGLTVGASFGQRGTIKNDLVRERYASISIGFNIHDIWFQKTRYK